MSEEMKSLNNPIVVQTADIRSALNQAKVGMGNGKILPITQYLNIEFNQGAMWITATDLTTWVQAKIEDKSYKEHEGESFIVEGPPFIKLMEKSTVKEIEITLENTHIEIDGDGHYTIPIMDEEYPQYYIGDNGEEIIEVEVNTQEMKRALQINEASIAIDGTAYPQCMSYKFSDKVITTDSVKMTVNNVNIFDGNEILLRPDIKELLSVVDTEVMNVMISEETGSILFDTPNVTIYTPMLEGLEMYPDIIPIVEKKLPANVVCNVDPLVKAIERLTIFSNPLKITPVQLEFKNNFILIYEKPAEDKQPTNKEFVNYVNRADIKIDETITVNPGFLVQILKSMVSDTVMIHYGDDLIVRLQDGKEEEVIHCLAQTD